MVFGRQPRHEQLPDPGLTFTPALVHTCERDMSGVSTTGLPSSTTVKGLLGYGPDLEQANDIAAEHSRI
jgi:hypothetical protein